MLQITSIQQSGENQGDVFYTLDTCSISKKSADPGSKGCKRGSVTELWRNGLNWLMYPAEWPKETEVYATEESDVEKKAVKEIRKAAIKKYYKHQHQILTKFNLKSLCVLA